MWSVAFLPCGDTLASGNGDWNRGGVVKLSRTTGAAVTGRFQHTGEVVSIAYAERYAMDPPSLASYA